MKLRFEIVAHKSQRYKTVGDYYQSKGVWWFRVSQMRDARYVWLVFIHEIIEWSLCRLYGIESRAIDKYDKAYEAGRGSGMSPCGCRIKDEPGDDIHAPYHDFHAVASQCERLIAKALDVDWLEYEDTIESL